MFDKVKLALRITNTAFDDEITALINDCLAELTMLGIYDPETMGSDSQILTAVIFYCKGRFGKGVDTDKWEKLYHDKVTKLLIAADYGARERTANA